MSVIVDLNKVMSRLKFTVNDLVKTSGASARQIRYWSDKGLLNPDSDKRGARYFSFEELQKAVRMNELLETGIYTLKGAHQKVLAELEERCTRCN